MNKCSKINYYYRELIARTRVMFGGAFPQYLERFSAVFGSSHFQEAIRNKAALKMMIEN